jgi:hypothetical protein
MRKARTDDANAELSLCIEIGSGVVHPSSETNESHYMRKARADEVDAERAMPGQFRMDYDFCGGSELPDEEKL